MRRPTTQEAAMQICVEYVKEIKARMDDPQAKWRNIDFACFVARAEAIEEVAKRIAKMEVTR